MKKLLLREIYIKNFKGIKELSVSFPASGVSIFAQNFTGKSSIFDAYCWLLFDKNSAGDKDFKIKPHDIYGNILDHAAQTTVLAVIIDSESGEITTLKKVYYEKWTTKNGNSEAIFSGNTSDFYIDDLPIKKTEYEAKIKEIISETVFKMLSSVYQFARLPWMDKRKTLLDIADAGSQDDILGTSEKYTLILKNKGKHTLEEYKKICQKARKDFSEEKESIPVRIQENQALVDEYSNIDYDGTKEQISEYTEKIAGINDKINALKGNVDSALSVELIHHKARLEALNTENNKYKSEQNDEYYEKLKVYHEAVEIVSEKIRGLLKIKRDIEFEIYSIKNDIIKFNSDIAQSRLNYSNAVKLSNDAGQISDEALICPTCHREYEQSEKDNIIRAIQERVKEFKENAEKIRADALELKVKIEELEIKQGEYLTKINEIQSEIDKYESEKAAIKEPLKAISDMPLYQDTNEEINYKISEIQKAIDSKSKGVSVILNQYNDEIIKAKIEIGILNNLLAKGTIIGELNEKISILIAKEREISQKVIDYDKLITLCEDAIRYETSFVEKSINSKFKIAEFKLFDTQINGGINAYCEIMMHGVTYGDLSSSEKINVGADIINTLSEYYSITVPLFVDNAECINNENFIKINTQIIKLNVSKDTEMRIEHVA